MIRKPEKARSTALASIASATTGPTRGSDSLRRGCFVASSGCGAFSGTSTCPGSRMVNTTPSRNTTVPMRSTQPAPISTARPAAMGAVIDVAISPANEARAFAVTSVISSGRTRGVTAARSTPNALDSTSTPNAAGRNVTWSLCGSALAIAQHSSARITNVLAIAYRRTCRARSSAGPISGATSANGAIVTTR